VVAELPEALAAAIWQALMIPYRARQLEPKSRMSLSNEEVRRIARLARIELSADETETTREQLNGIFAFIEQLQSVDTSGVEPMSHAVDVTQRLREDRVTETDRLEAFQKVAPEAESGLYLVPKVIE
jgi:aspartyl-tRNA(Asn)/glutamyl-tRNA(Gln) amidotransferase subunit C